MRLQQYNNNNTPPVEIKICCGDGAAIPKLRGDYARCWCRYSWPGPLSLGPRQRWSSWRCSTSRPASRCSRGCEDCSSLRCSPLLLRGSAVSWPVSSLRRCRSALLLRMLYPQAPTRPGDRGLVVL